MVLQINEGYEDYENDDYIDYDDESTQEAYYRIAEDNVRNLFGDYASINEDSFSMWDSGGYPGLCCEFTMYIDDFATNVFNKNKMQIANKRNSDFFNTTDKKIECEVAVKFINGYSVYVDITDISGSDYEVNQMFDDDGFMNALTQAIREAVENKLENVDILSDAF